ncbi:MAG: hypothetical protein UU64_C0007G0024 [candidate division WWE3 bacterium GW2011_GWF2_41_45]|uniref:DNA protecting protein DprA n=3 Tax=Katanobacteria TaxID=422282 RepID=A0A1F4VZN8_UNCKA|nr:MAG: hypothetical protein UU55_C0011G0019 [candidate division WWE3 bacterium GW2011_GWC2_41_23]KKS10211.1 MAG: hypothetical protein UU64_C0007G0024 [candidate division WWE3 bacterium GW2011_GWF2_41_45]KKS19553.1 MAG: hypothetical protein UU79_C0016G0020 [candidate division WWE3 bacterium GW2011_GWE1_41_72]KKS28417.1 MAG: hypothetical protein UU90_C0028G0010 [candidate division WWE3 bacterium GW2011_GWD2_42_11]KKS50499.1 MAG: hypothetical protein UV16_C0010G0008 [candidate division WWE3 bacte
MLNTAITAIVDFPKCSGSIKGLPEHLYIRGDLPADINARGLGIVGSRRISPYGIRVLRELFYYLKGSGTIIISGFTSGADSYAHEYALSAGCSTVAVMPCGCDIIHPSSNTELYKKISGGGGAVVSEFADGFRPQKWTYPKRNRLIAALSKILLVVEASLNSGSMITAHFAMKYGRKLFSVPGDIYMERSAGANKLVAGGAEIYLSPERIIAEMGLDRGEKPGIKNKVAIEGGLSEETNVLSVLKEKSSNFDKLFSETGIEPSALNAILIEMTLKNLISERNGVYYVL